MEGFALGYEPRSFVHLQKQRQRIWTEEQVGGKESLMRPHESSLLIAPIFSLKQEAKSSIESRNGKEVQESEKRAEGMKEMVILKGRRGNGLVKYRMTGE